MRPALLGGRAWTPWARRLRLAPAIALFSDFDGTLTPIVSRPGRARLPVSTRDLLRRLARQPGVFVGIVSGRPVAELRRLVRLPGLAYVGIHGIEIAWPGQRVLSSARAADRARVDQARRQLENTLADIRGVWVERKTASVAVHFRKAPAAAQPRIEREVQGIARRFAGQLALQRGKKVLELLPAIGASKASGVFTLLEKLPRWLGSAPLPIYLGDDLTDETVFRRLGGRGLSILVGRPHSAEGAHRHPSAARYFLADPAAVRKFLRELLALRSAAR